MASLRSKRLPGSFYNRPTLTVAKEVLGKHLVYQAPLGKISARIVEVEAYIGEDDPACHAARGKTARNEVMFGKPGTAYIYFIYGMYHCLNVVTEAAGTPAAVLIRAGEAVEGFNLMKRNSPKKNDKNILSGPGLFCRAFGLTTIQNGLDLTEKSIYLETHYEDNIEIGRSSRIGISNGKELLWRFYDKNSNALSGK